MFKHMIMASAFWAATAGDLMASDGDECQVPRSLASAYAAWYGMDVGSLPEGITAMLDKLDQEQLRPMSRLEVYYHAREEMTADERYENQMREAAEAKRAADSTALVIAEALADSLRELKRLQMREYRN